MIKLTEILKIVTVLTVISVILLYLQWLFKRIWLYAGASKIKGPFSLPILGAIFELARINTSEDFLVLVKSLFIKYGAVVKLWAGPYLLINCYKPDDMEIILNSPNCFDKSFFYHHVFPYAPSGVGLAKFDLWKKNRRILKNLLNFKLLDTYFDQLSSNTEELLSKIRDDLTKTKIDKNVNIYHTVENRFISLICETLLGLPEKSPITDKLGSIIVRINALIVKNTTKVWTYIDPIFNLTKGASARNVLIDEYRRTTKQLTDQTRKRLAEKEFEPGSEHAKQLLDTLIEEHNFTDEELHNEVAQLLLAGSDSSATTINYMLMCLGMFPKIQERVYQELMEVVGPHKMISNEDLFKLEYLERVMCETMRIFPVAPLISRVVAEDMEISNKVVLPAGAILVLAIYCTHMDPEHWPNPWKFDPDRFLPQEVAKRHPYAYLAFAAGWRNCLGYKYAKVNVKTYVASIVREFNVECGYKNLQEVRHEAAIVNKPVFGYKLKLHERNS